MYICLETMGKSAQIGTYEEILDFCTIYDRYIPTFDFGHINALTQGSLKTKEDFKSRLQFMIDGIGYERMKHFHVHFSKIEYPVKGEVRHLTFEDTVYGPDFTPLARALKKLSLYPFIICESAGTQDIDAKIMQNIYRGTI